MNTRLPDTALRRLLEEKLDQQELDAACALVADMADMHERALALTKAVQRKHQKAITGFMEAGADALVKSSGYGVSSLTVAVRMGEVALLKLLLHNHLPLSKYTVDVCWPAASKRQQVRVQQAIDEALGEAASCCSVDCLDFLLESGADCNVYFYHSDLFLSWCTPLVAACYAVYSTVHSDISRDRALAVISKLVCSGADIHKLNHQKDSPLFWAAAVSLDEAVSLLLRNGADVNIQNVFGQTPLMNLGDHYDESRADQFLRTVDVLVLHGADLGLADKDGWTAMHYAAQIGALPLVRLLLQNGANPNHDPTKAKQKPINSCLCFAVNHKSLEMVQMLLAKNADPINDISDVSPLKLACQLYLVDIAIMLFQNGAMEQDLVELIANAVKDIQGTATAAELIRWQWLQRQATKPRSLKIICRLTIRTCLGNRYENLDLPLPTSLVNYLNPFVSNSK